MNQLVFVKNSRLVTDSLIVAREFGKDHRNVMRDIETQLAKLAEAEESEWGALNFERTQYLQPQNKQWYPKYNMTEEAFVIIAMAYITPEAMKMKVKFIEEFKRLREQLNKPKTQLEILQESIAQLVEQEHRISKVENRVTVAEQKLDKTAELIALHPPEWRKKTTAILNKIARELGGYEAYQNVRNESYQLLEERAACNLSIRLTNRRRKMALEGAPKSKIDKTNRMDAIANDARLTEIYLAVVKEMAIRYQVSSDETIKNPK